MFYFDESKDRIIVAFMSGTILMFKHFSSGVKNMVKSPKKVKCELNLGIGKVLGWYVVIHKCPDRGGLGYVLDPETLQLVKRISIPEVSLKLGLNYAGERISTVGCEEGHAVLICELELVKLDFNNFLTKYEFEEMSLFDKYSKQWELK